MDKAYEPAGIEPRWYDNWEQQGYFVPAGAGEPYCIVLPPPNVTGSLHMGHAFQQTLMDVLIRYHRMRGDNTLWQCGTDHAGIATQMVVERQLEQQGKSRAQLGREEFLGAVWRWKETSGSTITRQSRRLGTSMDWTRERFTMDAGLSAAVQEVFIRLYEDGLIYRGNRLVNWDPALHTAVSDLEVVSEEEAGHLWHLRYPVAGLDQHVSVATTRPETMLGDTAVAVHPDDERYKHLVGREIQHPLTGRRIPIIADDYVDPEFGSGCVKITPAHDFNDYVVGQRHKLPLINIFDRDAKIISDLSALPVPDGHGIRTLLEKAFDDDQARSAIPVEYRGLDRFQARKRIVADLEAAGLLEKVEPHKLMVPRGDRSGAVIEPYLTDQWYVRIAPLAAPAIAAVEDGRIKFVPENWSKTYFEWMRNIQDWCISRQLWWGHRIPAWYADDGTVYVGRSEQEIRATHKLAPDLALRQDEDVLDTWFSSGLWPFSTLGWPEQTPGLRAFYPGAVLVTGFDIIFFWVARMIMFGLKFMGDVPFREVYIHGLVRDGEGQKMSKSKGNILDPLDLIDGIKLENLVQKRTAGLMRPQDAAKIEKATRREFPDGIAAYGTDALRMTFASLASPGRNINFDVGRIGGHRNFCNKLWNAARYVLMNVEDSVATQHDMRFSAADRWINSRLHHTVATVTGGINDYRFDLAAQAIHQFTWDDYCDWYLELSKPVLTDKDADPALQRGTRFTLVSVLETLLRLAHPLLPFITEEIWQRTAPLCGRAGPTIMRAPYPLATDMAADPEAEREIQWLQSFILGVRRIRGEMNISPGKPLTVLVRGGNSGETGWLAGNRNYIRTLARLERIDSAGDDAPESATALAGDMTILIPLADLIDPRAEKERLAKELAAREAEAERIAAKLGNAQFVERAPKEVVEKERQRHDELQQVLTTLRTQVTRLDTMLGTRAP